MAVYYPQGLYFKSREKKQHCLLWRLCSTEKNLLKNANFTDIVMK